MIAGGPHLSDLQLGMYLKCYLTDVSAFILQLVHWKAPVIKPAVDAIFAPYLWRASTFLETRQ